MDHPITLKTKEFALNYLSSLPEKMFRQLTMMDKVSFHLVSLIEGNPIFQNKFYCQQAPIKTQLAVTLDRLGHNANQPLQDDSVVLSLNKCCHYEHDKEGQTVKFVKPLRVSSHLVLFFKIL